MPEFVPKNDVLPRASEKSADSGSIAAT